MTAKRIRPKHNTPHTQKAPVRPGAHSSRPSTQTLKQLRAGYLDDLQRISNSLQWQSGVVEGSLSELHLENIYVPVSVRRKLPLELLWGQYLAQQPADHQILPEQALALLGKVRTSAAPTTVEDIVGTERLAVVVGEPGSGKTTLLKHLALTVTERFAESLPILASLRHWAAPPSPGGESLQQFLVKHCIASDSTRSNLPRLLNHAIAQGQAVVLLDDLGGNGFGSLEFSAALEAFGEELAARGNTLVVTSRVRDYRQVALDPAKWAVYTLQDFDAGGVKEFISRGSGALGLEQLGGASRTGDGALDESGGPARAMGAFTPIRGLPTRPFELALSLAFPGESRDLPIHRFQLYERYLQDQIIQADKFVSGNPERGDSPPHYTRSLAVLGPIALWLREKTPAIAHPLETDLSTCLAAYICRPLLLQGQGSPAGAAPVAQSNLREQAIEEGLVAHGLAQLGQLSLAECLSLIRQHLTDPAWHEVIVACVGVWSQVYQQPQLASEALGAILNMTCSGELAGQNILLAGDCLEDSGPENLGDDAVQLVHGALLTAARDRSLPVRVQRDAGHLLGRTGWRVDDLDVLVHIPAGPFKAGEDAHTEILDRPFAIGKYPVTNLQYERFVRADGYQQREFWSEEGWAWRSGTYVSRAKDEHLEWIGQRPLTKRNLPFLWHDPRWNNPLAPVVGVNWFEAEAYCRWLASILGQPTRLATEWEWERAARYTDGRDYPWGNTFALECANSAAFWGRELLYSASPTIVGQFAAGNSEDGVCDLCGNVWEWVSSWLDEARGVRVMRGGSWGSPRRNAGSAVRLGDVPDYFNDSVGFRVLCTA